MLFWVFLVDFRWTSDRVSIKRYCMRVINFVKSLIQRTEIASITHYEGYEE